MFALNVLNMRSQVVIEESSATTAVFKDSNGNALSDDDSVRVTKNLNIENSSLLVKVKIFILSITVLIPKLTIKTLSVARLAPFMAMNLNHLALVVSVYGIPLFTRKLSPFRVFA